MQFGNILKINKSAGWNKAVQVRILGILLLISYGFCMQIPKFKESAGWNKGVQVGKFPKFDKVCCTIIRETKVGPSSVITYSTKII